MASTQDVSVGMVLKFNGELCRIEEWQHRTPGNLRAFYQARMRNLKNGKIVENRFRSGETVEIIRVEYKELQFIYEEDDNIVAMDNETFEQVYVPKLLFGDGLKFLMEGMTVKVAFEGDNAITAEGPTFVEMEVTYTEPGVKGDTATNTLKQATMQTGAIVSVPLFVNTGDKIRVDTRTSSYMDRVK